MPSFRAVRLSEPSSCEEAVGQVEAALLSGDDLASGMLVAANHQARKRLLFGTLGLSAVLAGTAAVLRVVSGPSPTWQNPKTQALLALDEVGAAVACSAEGQNCRTSQCCLDGGEAGLQCWAKDQYYAVCLRDANCSKGVHPGEAHGTYDQYGTFHLDEWSCEPLGQRSHADCSTYSKESACPAARCDWFRTGQCMPKCAQFGSKDACPQSHCLWDGARCGVDPCSAAGEDCSSSRCCSAGRGAGGDQCFQKNKWWATCMDFCDTESTHKDFSCKKLGNRTPFPAPCTWAGEDCSKTHCCGNLGFSCAVKDDSFSGCVQTVIHSTWADTQVKVPDGWTGTILGGWSSEHQVPAAAEGAPLAGVSMFCFMAVLPNSVEGSLMEVSRQNSQSIFACNASAVFDSWQSSAAGWDTGTATLVNTAVFFKVWDQVRADGRYLKYDWTIKVDADCAFLPDRLRSQLWGLRVPAGAAVYLKNTNADAGLSNGQFLGAIEIFSKQAVETYFDNAEGCQKTMGENSGEDGFFKGCMDALGVGFMHAGEILKPDYSASYCRTEGRAAYHPLKEAAVLQNCYNAVAGKEIDWSHNTVAGLPR